jgi:protein-L-isoaspartate(D-aspartate) O-methyltransferase
VDDSTPIARQRYAEDLRYRADLHSTALIRAFAEVKRERFLGPGPWRIYNTFGFYYWTTPDADPKHLYHDVLVAIEEGRLLNNGLPSCLAFLIEALELKPGEHVAHLGCGTGYYTAIMAHVVGEAGRVTAVEIDQELANRAAENLSELKWVTVIAADASEYQFEPADAVLVNAGATHPMPSWLDKLRPGGRLLLPLTGTQNFGGVLKVTRHEQNFAARFITGINIFNCKGARHPEEEKLLRDKFMGDGAKEVRSLLTEPHEVETSCWFHTDNFCLTRAETKS